MTKRLVEYFKEYKSLITQTSSEEDEKLNKAMQKFDDVVNEILKKHHHV